MKVNDIPSNTPDPAAYFLDAFKRTRENRRAAEANLQRLMERASRAVNTGQPVMIAAGLVGEGNAVTVDVTPDGTLKIRLHKRTRSGWESTDLEPYDAVMDATHGDPDGFRGM